MQLCSATVKVTSAALLYPAGTVFSTRVYVPLARPVKASTSPFALDICSVASLISATQVTVLVAASYL